MHDDTTTTQEYEGYRKSNVVIHQFNSLSLGPSDFITNSRLAAKRGAMPAARWAEFISAKDLGSEEVEMKLHLKLEVV
ncbi:uncharacterized protein PADG_06574 [Paracoccidioides brasiliensis Pb18]|uniref:Uncharacterized protein n=1 Tax=Paracoccidioides brasiliensis (strain Pb18) TaxID=502780 RepID=C1GH38_PARBD|nr:uncharacterized protein PADG_06574 [Paracoccidioides brasiliensis Pb18]EEH50495.2 hypothetical protein PADG_06574 [Paracoccidioides brasiliensis Pb18]